MNIPSEYIPVLLSTLFFIAGMMWNRKFCKNYQGPVAIRKKIFRLLASITLLATIVLYFLIVYTQSMNH